jgi:hypothetical protein
MALKTFKCMNLGGCVNADTGKTFELADLGNPVCPVCSLPTITSVKKPPPIPSVVVAIVVALLVVGLAGLGYHYWPAGHTVKPPMSKRSTSLPPASTTPLPDCDSKGMEAAYRSGDCALVIKIGDQCLAKLPSDATVLNNVATCLLKSGRPDNAAELLQRALVLKPDDPYLHFNRACAAARLGKKEEAVEHLRTACHFGLAPATFRQDADLAIMTGFGPFEELVTNKDCK